MYISVRIWLYVYCGWDPRMFPSFFLLPPFFGFFAFFLSSSSIFIFLFSLLINNDVFHMYMSYRIFDSRLTKPDLTKLDLTKPNERTR